MIVDGKTDAIGSDRAAVKAASARVRLSQSVPITLGRTADGLSVQIPAGTVPAGQGEQRILLIGFDSAHRSTVPHGENTGREPSETNIVRGIKLLGSWTGQAMNLPLPMPPGVFQGERAAVLLQGSDGRILGAAVLSRPQS